ncbi:MAG: M50 family metallopeptidase [Planctomycetota bacterium]|nr:M50 family metallopeptidase [Planctomycetota bacterium]
MQIVLEPKPNKFDLNWSMLGVPTRVSPWFWAITLLMGWRKDVTLAPLAIWTACVFVSILLHEFGHALTAKKFGAYNVRVVLYHLGGLAIHEGFLTTTRRVIVLLMGPGAGFVLWGAVFGLAYAVDFRNLPLSPDGRYYLVLAVAYLLWINGIWGLVNLIPVYPLDGGQILKEVLTAMRPRGGARLAHSACMVVGIVAAAGFLAWCAADPKNGQLYPAVLFGVLAYQNYRLRQAYTMYDQEEEAFAPRQPWEQDPDWWKRGGR